MPADTSRYVILHTSRYYDRIYTIVLSRQVPAGTWYHTGMYLLAVCTTVYDQIASTNVEKSLDLEIAKLLG